MSIKRLLDTAMVIAVGISFIMVLTDEPTPKGSSNTEQKEEMAKYVPTLTDVEWDIHVLPRGN